MPEYNLNRRYNSSLCGKSAHYEASKDVQHYVDQYQKEKKDMKTAISRSLERQLQNMEIA
jgi:hypothetical protein